jgi:hypothetical protein
MVIIHEHSFQYVTLTRHSDPINNMTDWTFSTAAGAWDYGWWAYNTKAHFTVAVRRFTVMILKRNCNVYRLLVSWLYHKSKCTQCKMRSDQLRDFREALRWPSCTTREMALVVGLHLHLHYITFPGSKVSQNACRMWNKPYKYKDTYSTTEAFQKYIHTHINQYCQLTLCIQNFKRIYSFHHLRPQTVATGQSQVNGEILISTNL